MCKSVIRQIALIFTFPPCDTMLICMVFMLFYRLLRNAAIVAIIFMLSCTAAQTLFTWFCRWVAAFFREIFILTPGFVWPMFTLLHCSFFSHLLIFRHAGRQRTLYSDISNSLTLKWLFFFLLLKLYSLALAS